MFSIFFLSHAVQGFCDIEMFLSHHQVPVQKYLILETQHHCYHMVCTASVQYRAITQEKRVFSGATELDTPDIYGRDDFSVEDIACMYIHIQTHSDQFDVLGFISFIHNDLL